MKLFVEAGRTLLVDGPASAILISGEAEVLGAPMAVKRRAVIREGRRAPIEVKRTAELELMLGEGASYEMIEGTTLPSSWGRAVEAALMRQQAKGSLTAMVIGDIDSGKTSFCTYFANNAIREGLNVVIIDGDLGQSDVGPPCTISHCRLKGPVKDLFDLRAEDAYFVGTTSPGNAIHYAVKGFVAMKDEVDKKGFDLVIINTDGWVKGEDAARYKLQLIDAIKPDVVIGIQHEGELAHIIEGVRGPDVLLVERPLAIRERERERRKSLRELSYKKYLRGGRLRSFPMGWVQIERAPFGSGAVPSAQRLERIKSLLGVQPIYCEETLEKLFIALKKDQRIADENVKRLEEDVKKQVKVVYEGDEAGLILALNDVNGRFLGIGILKGICYDRRVVKIHTPVEGIVRSIQAGRLKIDEEGRELGFCWEFTSP